MGESPASDKMMKPRYQGIESSQIPEITVGNAKIKIICGEVNGVEGPVIGISVKPEYLDITVPPNAEFEHYVTQEYKAFAYVLEGEGFFDTDGLIGNEHLVIFDDGELVKIKTENKSIHFLLVSGKPINEPVAWYGPVVMNTQEEVDLAFDEYRKGTFIKS